MKRDLRLYFSQPSDPRDLGARHNEVLTVGAHAEARAAAHEILAGAARCGVVHSDVEQMDAVLVLGVETPYVRDGAGRLHDDRNTVELVVPRMKDVSAQATAPALKCLSKAFTRSPAMDCGLRPSIWCRWTKCTTSPSRSSAIEGLLG